MKAVNDKIDRLIIEGKTATDEYRRLTKLHLTLIHLNLGELKPKGKENL